MKRAVGALLLLSGAALGWSKLPSADARARWRLAGLEAAGPAELRTRLEEDRAGLLELLATARRQGDERAAAWLGGGLLDSSLTAAELGELSRIALSDVDHWDTALPPWRARVLERWVAQAPSERAGSEAARLLERVEVELTFRGAAGTQPYLGGNWRDDGALDDAAGWTYRPLARGKGGWTLKLKLQPTVFGRVYHAVVRTRPWPDGRAVGWTTFRLRKPAAFVIPGSAPTKAPRLEPRREADPKVGLALLLIDGGSLGHVVPLVHAGYLPNFGRVLREGAVGSAVASGEHFPSVPNIYSAMTGLLPFRHGLEFFMGMNLQRTPSPLWRMVASQGGRAASLGMHATFPLDRAGALVATDAFFALRLRRLFNVTLVNYEGDLTPFALLFGIKPERVRSLLRMLDRLARRMDTTEPPAFEDELNAALPAPEWSGSSPVMRLAEVFDTQIAGAARLLASRGGLDLLAAYLTAGDTAGHVFLNALAKPAGGAPAAQEKFRDLIAPLVRADAVLAEYLRSARHVMLLSDHGIGTPAYPVVEALDPIRVLRTFYRRSGLPPQGLGVRDEGGRWTVRLAASQRPLAPRLEEFLRGVRYSNGRAVFTGIARKAGADEELVGFGWQKPSPDWASPTHAGPEALAPDDLFTAPVMQGHHVANGMVMLWGPRIRPGPLPEPRLLADVAPTALYLLGYPVAEDFDGRVIDAALKPGELERDPPRRTPSYGYQLHPVRRLLRSIRWRSLLGGSAR